MGKDRTKPTPRLAAALARQEAMRRDRMTALEAKVAAQATQIKSLRAQLAASINRARVLEAAE